VGRERGSDSRVNLIRAAVAVVVLAVATFAGLALYADLGQLTETLADFRWELFPVALLLVTVNYAGRFWRWELYRKRVGIDIPVARSASIFLAGLFGTITPMKAGELLKSWLLRRSYGVPVRRSAPIVAVERVTDALGVVLLAAAAGADRASAWPLLIAAVVGSIAVAALLHAPQLDRFERLIGVREASRALLTPGLTIVATLLAAVSWLFECLAAQVIVRGLGLDGVSLADTVVVFSVGSLAGAATFLPGGLGVAEGSMTGLYQVLSNVSADAAAAATVLIRLATLWYATALGGVFLLLERRRFDSRRGGDLLGSRDGGDQMPGKDHGPSIKDPELYERLRKEGESKEKAARIANEAAAEGRSEVGRRGGKSEPYEEWTVDELQQRAKEIGITGYSEMAKRELIDALRNH
jgi:uncharacterized membrane protein YbhN (UPF0104 family)